MAIGKFSCFSRCAQVISYVYRHGIPYVAPLYIYTKQLTPSLKLRNRPESEAIWTSRRVTAPVSGATRAKGHKDTDLWSYLQTKTLSRTSIFGVLTGFLDLKSERQHR